MLCGSKHLPPLPTHLIIHLPLIIHIIVITYYERLGFSGKHKLFLNEVFQEVEAATIHYEKRRSLRVFFLEFVSLRFDSESIK